MTETATVTSGDPAPLGRALLLPGAVLVALGAGLGAAAGRLWWSWWSPGFTGEIFDTARGPMWLPEPFDPGFADSFTGTGQYVVVGLGAAIVLGVVAGLLLRSRAVAGLAAVVLAAVIAGAVMLVVGTAPSPPDPQTFATADQIGTRHAAQLDVTGWTPYLCWPVGALLGYAAFMVLSAGSGALREREDDPRWLQVSRDRSEPSPQP